MTHINARLSVKSFRFIAYSTFITLLLTLISAQIVSAQAPPPQMGGDAVPTVTVDAPAEVFIGEQFTFTVTFDNTGTETGYGPFIDIYFPASGIDGNGGIIFDAASYFGGPVQIFETVFTVDGCVDHPIASGPVTPPHNAVEPYQVCGSAGDRLVTVRLPFGSFTPGQAPAEIEITATMSGNADLDVPLTLYARGGFEFGEDPLDNPCCDAPITAPFAFDVTAWPPTSITPTLIEFEKENDGPEGETATGPNFPRTYTISVTTAPVTGTNPVSPLVITDYLPTNIVYLGTDAPGGTVTQEPAIGAQVTPANRELIVEFPSVGAAGATFTVEFYVSLIDGDGGDEVLDSTSGDFNIVENRISATGGWIPLDGTDPTLVGATFTGGDCPNCPPANELSAQSIAVQKSSTPGEIQVGSVITYTIQFQISDYFAFGDVVITDILGDGQLFNAGFAPTLRVTAQNNTTGPAALDAANFSVTGPDAVGETTIIFNVSDELVTRGLDGDIFGGCIPTGGITGPQPDCGTFDLGGATGTIVFEAIVQSDYIGPVPGDSSIDQGDFVGNIVTITGNVLDRTDPTLTTGGTPSDDSGASSQVPRGNLVKSIYAIDGVIGSPGPNDELFPGQTVTYRLQYDLPTTSFEDLLFIDNLPLPVFFVNNPNDDGGVTQFTFDSGIAGTAPPAGFITYGPAHTLSDFYTPLDASIPSIDVPNNALLLDFGTHEEVPNVASTVDILFTVRVNNQPFADALFLTNQALASESSSFEDSQEVSAIVQITLRQPVLVIRKGVTDTDNPNGQLSSDPAGDPSDPVNSDDLNDPDLFNSDLTGVNAGDSVEFTIAIENQGGSAAYEITISDIIPFGMEIPTPFELTIVRGDGQVISFTAPDGSAALPEDLFTTGIKLVDPPGQGICQPFSPTAGSNIILITYTLVISDDVPPGTVIQNLGAVVNYANTPDGPNFLDDPLEDDATVTIDDAEISKQFVASSEAHTSDSTTPPQVAIGEIVRYRLNVLLPEGGYTDTVVRDNIPTGLQFLDDDTARYTWVTDGTITGSPNLSPTGACIVAGDDPSAVALNGIDASCVVPGTAITPATFGSGTDVNFDVGDFVVGGNPNTDTYLLIEFNALVMNIGGNGTGTNRNNNATLIIDGRNVDTTDNVPVTIVEPVLTVNKTVNVDEGEAGDPAVFTITVTNSGTLDAFDVDLTDIVPAALDYVVTSWSHDAGLAPTTISDAGAPTLTATWDVFPAGATSTFTFNVTLSYNVIPGQPVTNTARVEWTSLPGTGSDATNPTGSTTPGGSGDVDGERDGSDTPAVNDYNDEDDATVIVFLPQPGKEIITTSEAFTSDDPSLTGETTALARPVAIGEIIRYRLTTSIPEGTSPDYTVIDTLPAGFGFIADDQVTIQFFSDGGIISSNAALNAADPNAAPVVLFDAGGNPTVAGVVSTSGQEVIFSLGTLNNNDNDPDLELIVIEFNALVLNTTANSAGQTKPNSYRVEITGSPTVTSDPVYARIVEPNLNIAKTFVDGIEPNDANDTFTYRIVITADSTADNTNAYEVVFTDVIDTFLTIDDVNVTVTPAVGLLNIVGQTVTLAIDVIEPGDTITIDIPVTVNDNVPAGYELENTAEVIWTSLPGDGSDPNPTGSTTPGDSGDTNGERTGDDTTNPANTYQAEDDADVTLDDLLIEKTITSTSQNGAGAPAGSETPVTIGEIIDYQLVITIPEGESHNVFIDDQLTDGIAFIADDTVTIEFLNTGVPGIETGNPALDAANSGPVALFTPDGNPAPGLAGIVIEDADATPNLLRFDLGTLFNTDNDPDTEQIVIRFRVVVLDAGVNTLGRIIDNTAEVSATDPDDTIRTTRDEDDVDARVVEPALTITKGAAPTSVGAGDTVTFTISVSNAAGPNNSIAYDVAITDVIPAGLTYTGNVTATAGDAPTVDASALPVVTFSWAEIAPGATNTFTFTATVDPTVSLGDEFVNIADIISSTLPGEEDDEREYNDSDDAPTVTVAGDFDLDKRIFNTSAGHTGPGGAGDPEPVAVGEVVTFRLVTTIPAATLETVSKTDILIEGLEYVADSARIGIIGDITFDDPAFGGATVLTDANDPIGFTFPIPNVVQTPLANATQVDFNIGDVTNAGPGTAVIVLEFQALVVNEAAATIGAVFENNYTVNYDATNTPPSNTVELLVVEPELNISKSAAPASVASGDVVSYTITVTPTNGANNTTAFDVVIIDTLPAGLTLNVGSVTVATSGGVVGVTNNSAGNTVSIAIVQMPVGSSATITFNATVNAGATLGDTFINDASVEWTSLPGADPNERDGSGFDDPTDPNDYRDEDDATVTVDGNFAIVKSIFSTSADHTDGQTPETVTIGEIITFRLAVGIPAVTLNGIEFTDILVPGIELLTEPDSIRIGTLGTAPLTFEPVFGTVAPIVAPGGATTPYPATRFTYDPLGAREIVLDVGEVTNGGPGMAIIVVEFDVVVVDDTLVNNLGQVWANEFTFDSDDTAPETSDEVEFVIVEPQVTVEKQLVSPTSPASVNGGDTVIYDVVITASGAANTSTAFDLTVTDTLDAALTLVSAVVTDAPAYVNTTDNTAAPLVSFTFDQLEPGDSITITITATVNVTVTDGDTINNNAALVSSSLPGEEDGERTYQDDDDAPTVTVNLQYGAEKQIAGTSAPHTPETGGGSSGNARPVAIGEIITYRLVTTIPEGTSTDVLLVDPLVPNIAFVPGSATISYLATDSGIAGGEVTFPTLNGLGVTPLDQAAPTTSFPAAQISDNIVFNIGTVINNGSANPFEFIIIDFQVVVVNELVNGLGDIWPNEYSVFANIPNPDPATDDPVAESNEVFAQIVEPQLSISKSNNAVDPVAGDTVTYTLTIAHTGASTADAFDIVVSDTLPSQLDYVPGSASIAPTSIVGQTLTWEIPALTLADASLTITFEATVNNTVTPDQTVDNTAAVTWTSLPGVDPNERDGSDTPEQNDYNDSDDSSITVGDATRPEKRIAGESDPTAQVPFAIGDVVTFELVVFPNPGTTPTLTLTDTFIPQIEYVPGTINVTTSANVTVGSTADAYDAGTRTLTVTLNNTVNTADTNEFVIVSFDAVVVNAAGSTSGAVWTNEFSVAVNGGTPIDSNEVSIVIIEPELTITKTANDTTPSAGDTITYTLTIAHTGASETDAFDLVIVDTLPAQLQYVGGSGNPAPTSVAGQTLTWEIAALTLADGSTTITFDVLVLPVVTVGETIPNTADLTWTSQPGPNPNERDGSGTPDQNDYNDSDDETLTIEDTFAVQKTIAGSSDPNEQVPVAIGDEVTFRLTTEIARGTSNNIVLDDLLVPGIKYVVDSARVSYLANVDGVLTFSGDLATANPQNEAVPSVVLPDTLISVVDNVDDTQTVTFSLGNIVNSAAGAGSEFVIIEFTVLVINDSVNESGDIWTNEYSVTVDGGTPETSNEVSLIVVEPDLTVSKTTDAVEPIPGATFSYTLRVEHTGDSTTDAFDLRIDEIVPAELAYLGNVQATGDSDVPAPAVDDSGDPAIVFTIPTLALGQVAEFTFDVQIIAPLAVGDTVFNEVLLRWTSQPGDDNPEQRDGSGFDSIDSPNDYFDEGDETITIGAALDFEKRIGGISESDLDGDGHYPVTYGDIVIYELVILVNKGNTPSLEITDIFVPGIEYDPDSIEIEIIGPVTIDTETITYDEPTRTLTVELDGIENTAPDGLTQEFIIIRFEVEVIDDEGINSIGQIWANLFEYLIDSATEGESNEVTIIIVPPLPDLVIEKSHEEDFFIAGFPDPYTYTLVVSNTGRGVVDVPPIIVTDDVPEPFLSVVSAGGTDWDCAVTGNSVSCEYIGVYPVERDAVLPEIEIEVLAIEAGAFDNVAVVSAPNVTELNDGNNTATDPTIVQRPTIFDPPFGRKTVDASGLPILEWGMFWVNPGNITAFNVRVTDPIPVGTTYVDGSFECVANGASVTTLCEYDAVNNQVVWEGTIAPDPGIFTLPESNNAIILTFRTTVLPGVTSVENTARANWDDNSDGDIDDDISGGQIPISVDASWSADDPDAPEQVEALPTPMQPEDLGITELPATGETPLWRDLILLAFGGLLALVVAVGAALFARRREA